MPWLLGLLAIGAVATWQLVLTIFGVVGLVLIGVLIWHMAASWWGR